MSHTNFKDYLYQTIYQCTPNNKVRKKVRYISNLSYNRASELPKFDRTQNFETACNYSVTVLLCSKKRIPLRLVGSRIFLLYTQYPGPNTYPIYNSTSLAFSPHHGISQLPGWYLNPIWQNLLTSFPCCMLSKIQSHVAFMQARYISCCISQQNNLLS